MRIIGLKLREMDKLITKNLSCKWYPLGDYDEPKDGGYVCLNGEKDAKRTEINKKLYRLSGDDAPEIHVSCIAGRNGSGKSTFLDIMFRIINNLAYKFLHELDDCNVEWAQGVNADLHYEVDGKLGFVENRDHEIRLFWGYTEDGEHREIEVEELGLHEALHHFFYTICINYSIYSFHVADYELSPLQIATNKKTKNGINGKWLEKTFHKNDGYLMPLTLAPYRDKQGNVDMGRERTLAMQRLTALILFFHLNGQQFIEGYMPIYLYWAYDDQYLKIAIEKLNSDYLGFSTIKLNQRLNELSRRWELYFEKKGYQFKEEETKTKKICLRYLAYKTLKICSIYSVYKKMYWESKGVKTQLYDNIIDKIVGKLDHVTVKIHQCLHYVEEGDYGLTIQQGHVDKLFGKYGGIVKSYDEMMKLLPPSFFKIDMEMCKEKRIFSLYGAIDLKTLRPPVYENLADGFRLGSMSSGERQFLNSISYALYHIKNIEGVIDDYNRVHYHHINLVLDEAELYYHPEYQRRYVKMLLEALSWCKFKRPLIKSIHIIIVTHSPFILSDIVSSNILYLEDGEVKKRDGQTFGANYYDMLYNSFFFEKNAIGEIASGVIKQVMKNPEEMTDALSEILGDPIIRGYLLKKHKRYVQDKTEKEQSD